MSTLLQKNCADYQKIFWENGMTAIETDASLDRSPAYISLAEISRRLGIGYSAIRKANQLGDLPDPVRIGGRQLYPVARLLKIFPEMPQR